MKKYNPKRNPGEKGSGSGNMIRQLTSLRSAYLKAKTSWVLSSLRMSLIRLLILTEDSLPQGKDLLRPLKLEDVPDKTVDHH